MSVSSEVSPVYREYERASTTALNAYVIPAVNDYIGRVEDGLGVLPRHRTTTAICVEEPRAERPLPLPHDRLRHLPCPLVHVHECEARFVLGNDLRVRGVARDPRK